MKTKIVATRRLQFCAGHRVFKHEGKCKNVHGHNYVAFFHAESPAQVDGRDKIGRVIDFGVLKERIGEWIESRWDHGMLLWSEDPIVTIWTDAQLVSHKLFVLPNNPTAENMAEYLLHDVCPTVLHGTNVVVTKVVLWETENCFAEVSLREVMP